MQITADSMGVYTKVFSLSLYQHFDVIRQWSVQWCLMAGPACLYIKSLQTTSCVFTVLFHIKSTSHVQKHSAPKIYVSLLGSRMRTHRLCNFGVKNTKFGRESCIIKLKIDSVETKCAVLQVITIICVAHVQKIFRFELQ